MREKQLKKASLFNHFIQAVLFSSIFVFTSNIRGIRTIFERSVHAILFPIAIIPDVIASLLALFSFTRAKNKNLGKTFDLFYIPFKAAVVLTAVFAGLSLIAVQSLFLAAVGSGILYHASLCLYNIYQWLRTTNYSENKALKNIYKNNLIANGVSTLIGGVVIAGILVTMVFSPYLGASIVAIAGIGTAAALLLMSAYTLYRHFNPQVNSHAQASPTLISEPLLDSPHKLISNNYYYRKCRSKELTGNLNTDKEYLIDEINTKKYKLKTEIKNSESSIKERIWPENPKRRSKLDYLENRSMQLNILCQEKKQVDSIPFYQNGGAQNDKLCFFAPPPGTFQSFFHETGDMQDLDYAIQSYIEKYHNNAANLHQAIPNYGCK